MTALTDERIIAIRKAAHSPDPAKQWGDTLAFARAIESASSADSFELGRAHGITHAVDTLNANPALFGMRPIAPLTDAGAMRVFGKAQALMKEQKHADWDARCIAWARAFAAAIDTP